MRAGAAQRALRTLSADLGHLAERTPADLGPTLERLVGDLDDLRRPPRDAPHPSLPAPGTATSRRFAVAPDDTAAAMGHPDPRVQVPGTPRIGLWFEIAASDLMPDPGVDARHVGVGLVVHHVGSAAVGEEVVVTVTVAEVDGRAIVFACEALRGEDLVAAGTHHRVVVASGG